jgi:hypothetical protein
MIKLTKPQLELLRELHAQSTWGMYCVDTYPPCIKLQSHGLARYRVGDLSIRLYITDAGHKYLRDLDNLEHKPA